MVVSFDRLVAVKYPYTYEKMVTKNVYKVLICVVWVAVLCVDSVPFFPLDKIPDEGKFEKLNLNVINLENSSRDRFGPAFSFAKAIISWIGND